MGAILVIVGCSRRSKKSSYQNDTIDTSNLFFMTDLRGYFFVSLGRPKHHQLLIVAAVVLMTSIPASGEFWFTRMGMCGLRSFALVGNQAAQNFVWEWIVYGIENGRQHRSVRCQLWDQSPVCEFFNSPV